MDHPRATDDMAATAACRILVVSSTTDTGHQFVQRIKALSNPSGSDESSSNNTSTQVASSQPPTQTSGGLSELHAQLTNSEPAISIPWTICNKYYTADVHFELRQLDGFAGYLASEVPAVVYVWDRKEQHKQDIPELAKKLQHYDPEVSLAVRFTGNSSSEGARADEDEGDEDGLDEFISSHGFEYVDGERGRRVPTGEVSSFSDEDSSGVPGLPRVIDALSTIMWPSLVQTQRTGSRRKSRGGDLLDWASIEDPHGTHGGAPLLQNTEITAQQSRIQKEMDELESWLQDEVHAVQDVDEDEDTGSTSRKKDHDDPWSTAHGRQIDGYTDLHFNDNDHDEHRFDDDFDDFVGAPMDVTYGDPRGTSARDPTTRYPASLSFSQSLTKATTSSTAPQRAFTSDFVAFPAHSDEDADEQFDDDDDAEMPSRAEIEEMSRRLFGGTAAGQGSSLNIPSTSSEWQRLHSPSMQSNSAELPHAHATTVHQDSHPTEGISTGEGGEGDVGEDQDDEYELEAFDLSKVLGALQGMKEQIAGMEDEGERRRAAAKVALGLVYGLQKEEERDPQRV